MARHADCATAEVLEAVERLASDAVPGVRFEIASYLNALYKTAPELMWKVIGRLCREEQDRLVLQGMLGGPLDKLSLHHPDQVSELTIEILSRLDEGGDVGAVRRLCLAIVTSLYIWRNHERCGAIVKKIATDPQVNPDAAGDMLHQLRSVLTHGPVSPAEPSQDEIRRRAFEFFIQLLQAARNCFDRIQAEHQAKQFNDWPEEDQKTVQSLSRVIDAVGREIYYASGAYGQTKPAGDKERAIMSERSKRFYHEAAPLLDELADVGFPSLAHHVLQTLESFIPFDPSGVFLRIGRVVRGGRKGGYQYESLAVDLMVQLIERYLADYRSQLREDEECRRTLVEVLDTFVKAGWPSARRLSYRLDEIFR